MSNEPLKIVNEFCSESLRFLSLEEFCINEDNAFNLRKTFSNLKSLRIMYCDFKDLDQVVSLTLFNVCQNIVELVLNRNKNFYALSLTAIFPQLESFIYIVKDDEYIVENMYLF